MMLSFTSKIIAMAIWRLEQGAATVMHLCCMQTFRGSAAMTVMAAG